MSSLAATVKSNHPLKPLGRRCAPPTKKPPAWATVWVFPRNSLLWLELRYGNITFADELDFDPAELDIVYEDNDTEVSQ